MAAVVVAVVVVVAAAAEGLVVGCGTSNRRGGSGIAPKQPANRANHANHKGKSP